MTSQRPARAETTVVQFTYGDDGLDPIMMESYQHTRPNPKYAHTHIRLRTHSTYISSSCFPYLACASVSTLLFWSDLVFFLVSLMTYGFIWSLFSFAPPLLHLITHASLSRSIFVRHPGSSPAPPPTSGPCSPKSASVRPTCRGCSITRGTRDRATANAA